MADTMKPIEIRIADWIETLSTSMLKGRALMDGHTLRRLAQKVRDSTWEAPAAPSDVRIGDVVAREES